MRDLILIHWNKSHSISKRADWFARFIIVMEPYSDDIKRTYQLQRNTFEKSIDFLTFSISDPRNPYFGWR